MRTCASGRERRDERENRPAARPPPPCPPSCDADEIRPRHRAPRRVSRPSASSKQDATSAAAAAARTRRAPVISATTASRPILSALSSATSAAPCSSPGHAGHVEDRRQQLPMVQADGEIGEAEASQHVGAGREQFGLDRHRRRADGIDVALVELAEAALLRAIGAPHRLHLVALEVPRQRGPVLGHHARQRHRQVVAQRQVGLRRSRRLLPASGS